MYMYVDEVVSFIVFVHVQGRAWVETSYMYHH